MARLAEDEWEDGLPKRPPIGYSIPKDQNDQGPRHSSHMGGDTLECRVGSLVNQFCACEVAAHEGLQLVNYTAFLNEITFCQNFMNQLMSTASGSHLLPQEQVQREGRVRGHSP